MKRIHIIDNSAFNRKQVIDTLIGYSDTLVTEFDNPNVARLSRYSNEDPDVVFVNASFPDSFAYIQEMTKSSKVVALINFGQLALAAQAKKMGADEVVFMPTDPFQMRQVVNRVLNG